MRGRPASFLTLVLILTSASCHKPRDQRGATVNLTATPTTIVLASPCLDPTGLLGGVDECGTSRVVATVSSSMGVPLPDQDVRFTGTAGFLFTGTLSNPEDAANLPIRTDDFGNAEVNLLTAVTTTVTARSGKATETLTLNTVKGNLSQITLNLDTVNCPFTSSDITSSSQEVCLVATALDNDNVGIPNLVIPVRVAEQ